MNKILISGATSGIGKTLALKLLQAGNSVVGMGRDHQKFQPDSQHYYPITIDFNQIEKLNAEFKTIQKQHADINTLICTAGYGHFVELEQFSIQQMQKMLNVNFLSQAILIKHFLPTLKTNENSKIIIIGSECALDGQKKGSMYCASKFALRGLSQSLRKECASANVAVTMINPGMVDTPFFDELNFRPGDDKSNAIQPEQICTAIEMILHLENNCVIEEVNLQPMKKVARKI